MVEGESVDVRTVTKLKERKRRIKGAEMKQNKKINDGATKYT